MRGQSALYKYIDAFLELQRPNQAKNAATGANPRQVSLQAAWSLGLVESSTHHNPRQIRRMVYLENWDRAAVVKGGKPAFLVISKRNVTKRVDGQENWKTTR